MPFDATFDYFVFYFSLSLIPFMPFDYFVFYFNLSLNPSVSKGGVLRKQHMTYPRQTNRRGLEGATNSSQTNQLGLEEAAKLC